MLKDVLINNQCWKSTVEGLVLLTKMPDNPVVMLTVSMLKLFLNKVFLML